MNKLFAKYDKRTPRYTSYPAMPFWNDKLNSNLWMSRLKEGLEKSNLVDIYIHIPYCSKLCWYCGCNREITKNKSKADRYIEALLREFKSYIENVPTLKVNSIHFGGGTPNFLGQEQFELLLSTFKPFMTPDFEGAIEIDPRVCKREQLELLARYDFKRISLGVQDFDDRVQQAINRKQSFALVQQVCEWAREYGFAHFNFDLIWGLPLQTCETIKETVRLCKLIGPDQISFYSYAHLPQRFKHQRLIKDTDLLKGSEKRALYDVGREEFNQSGYVEIGMDHYAKKDSLMDKAQKNNKLTRNFMGYTDKKAPTLIGLGASSISSNEFGLIQNIKEVNEYIDAIENQKSTIEKSHMKEGEDSLREEIIQQLMCNLIIEESKLRVLKDFKNINEELSEMVSEGLLLKSEKGFYVSSTGRVFIRCIAAIFDTYKVLETHATKFSKSV